VKHAGAWERYHDVSPSRGVATVWFEEQWNGWDPCVAPTEAQHKVKPSRGAVL
jgi:hypothetical protein